MAHVSSLLLLCVVAALLVVGSRANDWWQDMEVDFVSIAILYRALSQKVCYASSVQGYACAAKVHRIMCRGVDTNREYVIRADACQLDDAPRERGFCFNCKSLVPIEFKLAVDPQLGKDVVTSMRVL